MLILTREPVVGKNTILIGDDILLTLASLTPQVAKLRVVVLNGGNGIKRFAAHLRVDQKCQIIKGEVSVMLTGINQQQAKLGIFAPQYKINRAEVVSRRAEQGDGHGQHGGSGGAGNGNPLQPRTAGRP